MFTYIRRQRKKIIVLASIIIFRQALLTNAAILNASALTSIANQNFVDFIKAEMFVIINWAIIILCDRYTKINKANTIQDINIDIRNDISKSFSESGHKMYHSQSVGTHLSWLNNDIENINKLGLEPFFLLIRDSSAMVFSFFVLIRFHYLLSIITVIGAFLFMLIPKIYNNKIKTVNLELTKENENFVESLEDTLYGFDVLLSMNTIHTLAKRIEKASKDYKKINVKKAKLDSVVSLIGYSANIIFQVVLITFSGYLVFIGQVQIGILDSVSMLADLVFSGLSNFNIYLSSIKGVAPIFSKFNDYKAAIEINNSNIGNLNTTSNEIIQAKRLAYKYNNEEYLFKNIDFKITQGKKYLITGNSGTGKSTLFKILCGYLNDYSGSINIFGTRIKDLSATTISEHITYIHQDTYLFKGTVKSNLQISNDSSDEKLLLVLNRVGFKDPSKMLNKEVGHAGANLSRGQRQRIALARAFLSDKKILFIDEGFSSLDKNSAYFLEKNLLIDTKLTLLMISHTNSDEIKEMYDEIITLVK